MNTLLKKKTKTRSYVLLSHDTHAFSLCFSAAFQWQCHSGHGLCDVPWKDTTTSLIRLHIPENPWEWITSTDNLPSRKVVFLGHFVVRGTQFSILRANSDIKLDLLTWVSLSFLGVFSNRYLAFFCCCFVVFFFRRIVPVYSFWRLWNYSRRRFKRLRCGAMRHLDCCRTRTLYLGRGKNNCRQTDFSSSYVL